MKEKLVYIIRYWLPAIAWMLLIYYLSSFHKLSISEVSWQDFITRKFAHLTEYAILAGLLYRALGGTLTLAPKYRLLLAILLGVLYSVSDEYHQTLVSGRTGRWLDIGIDSIGVIIGALMLRFKVLRQILNTALPFRQKP